MSCDKEVGEVVSAIISLVNNQCSFLVELLRVLTVMLAQKRLVKKRLLMLMSSESKMQNGKKGSRRSRPRFKVRSHRNLKWWNDFMNGTMIPDSCLYIKSLFTPCKICFLLVAEVACCKKLLVTRYEKNVY